MKPDIRILGVDDGPFTRGLDGKTPLVGVLMRVNGVIESVLTDYIEVDGSDTLGAIEGFVEKIGRGNVNLILTEGITFGGFDIIMPEEIFLRTGVPFLSVTKGKGNLDAMSAALEKHGDSGKLEKLRSLKPIRRSLRGVQVTLNMSGIDEKDAIPLIEKLMRVGNIPEPVRIADMIAFSIRNGLSDIP